MMKLMIAIACFLVAVPLLTGCCLTKSNDKMFDCKKSEVEPRPMMVGKKWSVNETYTGLDRETSRVTF